MRLLPYMADNGWKPTVVTTHKGDYPVYDESLCSKIPSDINVIRTKTPVLAMLYGKISGQGGRLPHGSLETGNNASLLTRIIYWMRINLIAPDVRMVWNKAAVKAVVKELQRCKYDVVVTTGPPHSTHLTGLKIKKKFPVKWVTDFRDPWTKINYLQTVKQNPIIKMFNRSLERKVLQRSDLNLIISKTIAKSLPAGKKKVLFNGYDPQDFQDLTHDNKKNETLRIKYVGKIRTGHPLKTVISWLEETLESKIINDVEMSFIGSFDEKQVPITDYLRIRNIPHATHKQALQEMVASEVLLLLIRRCPDNKGILTTKLFEYIASGSFILGVGPTDGEAADILESTNTGIMIDYEDKDRFIKVMAGLYHKSRYRLELREKENDYRSFSAPQQAKQLAHYLEEL